MSSVRSVSTAPGPQMVVSSAMSRGFMRMVRPMVHSAAVKLRLDYGTDGLDATLPDERVTQALIY